MTVVVLVDGDVEVIIGRVHGVRPDLALVDALLRLHLAARRLGCSIRLREPGEPLCDVLDLVGVADVVGARLPLDARRETEGGEELGVEEVMQPGDPSA